MLNVRWKAGPIYIIVATLILAGWLGNIAFYYDAQLPQAGFLRHYIETTDESGASFMLLYAANRQDKRQIRHVTIDDLPNLRFYPPDIHTQLRHQTIYRMIGRFEPLDTPSQKQAEPVIIREIGVHYSDGTYVRENIGEIRVYPQAAHVVAAHTPYPSESEMRSYVRRQKEARA